MPINDWLDEDRRLDEEGLRAKVIETALARYHERRDNMGETNGARLERHLMLQSLDRHWKEHLTQMDQLRKGIHLRGYAQKDPTQEYKRESFDLFNAMLGAIKSDTVQDLSRVHVPTKEEIEALQEEQRLAAERMREAMHYEHNEVNGVTGETSQAPDIAKRNNSAQQATAQNTATQKGGHMRMSIATSATVNAEATQSANTANTDLDANVEASADANTEENPYADMMVSRNAPCPCGSGLRYKQCHGKI